MNLAYFRTSSFNLEMTVNNLTTEATKRNITILGKTILPNNKGVVLHLSNQSWLGNLIASDKNLIGLLPNSIVVVQENGKIQVGIGSPAVLGSVSQNPAINLLASEVQKTVTDIIHEAAGVKPRRPEHITLYSTTTCPYCKMEAAWLTEKKIHFDEVHVDQDQKEAETMVQKTGQMGVPVTAVRYEDGEEEYIVGFDKPRLAQIMEVQ